MDGVHDERPLHARERTDAGVAPLELLHREPVAHFRQPRAPVALQVAPEEAELRDLGDELRGERAALPVVGDARQDARVHEGADGALDGALLGREMPFEVEEVGHGPIGAREPSA